MRVGFCVLCFHLCGESSSFTFEALDLQSASRKNCTNLRLQFCLGDLIMMFDNSLFEIIVKEMSTDQLYRERCPRHSHLHSLRCHHTHRT